VDTKEQKREERGMVHYAPGGRGVWGRLERYELKEI